MRLLTEYRPSKTISDLYNNKTEINIIRGVPGSGKTLGSIYILLRIAMAQVVANDGCRYTRFCVLRDTYPNLDQSVIKTFEAWMPFKVDKSYPRSCKARFILADKSIVNTEFVFLAINDKNYQKALDSKEYTCFFLNELSALNKDILDMAQERLWRYPTNNLGGITYSGIVCDTNTKNQSNWIYDLEMHGQHKGLKVWVQPAPLLEVIKDDGTIVYKKNPKAENIRNLSSLPKIKGVEYTEKQIYDSGFNYYIRLLKGKSQSYIDERLLNRYSPLKYGMPVYDDAFKDNSILENIDADIRQIIHCGFDTSGFSPAVIFLQYIDKKVYVIDELIVENIPFEIFIIDILLKYLSTNYAGYKFKFILDPSNPRDALKGITPLTYLQKQGFYCKLALSNKFKTRSNTAVKYIRDTANFFVSRKCVNFIEGLKGKYKRKVYKTPNGIIPTDEAEKDEYSHIQDAFQYAIMEINILSERRNNVNINRLKYQKIICHRGL